MNDLPTNEISTLSLHDALPILPDLRHSPPDQIRRPEECRPVEVVASGCRGRRGEPGGAHGQPGQRAAEHGSARDVQDRKSTRLNSSHTVISYAVFCLKKKIYE